MVRLAAATPTSAMLQHSASSQHGNENTNDNSNRSADGRGAPPAQAVLVEEAILTRAVTADPADPDNHYALGVVQAQLGKLPQAAASLEQDTRPVAVGGPEKGRG